MIFPAPRWPPAFKSWGTIEKIDPPMPGVVSPKLTRKNNKTSLRPEKETENDTETRDREMVGKTPSLKSRWKSAVLREMIQ